VIAQRPLLNRLNIAIRTRVNSLIKLSPFYWVLLMKGVLGLGHENSK
jgi:hypothetical protein